MFFFPNAARKCYPQLDVELAEDGNMQLVGFTRKFSWYNKRLNDQQKQAVLNILRGEYRPTPYVIFGPPGTGKTMTIIETILQIAKNVQGSRIIVGTPSNSSANLITELLIESKQLQTGDFMRLVSYNQIEKELIPEHLARYCGTVEIGHENGHNATMFLTKSGLKMRCQKSEIGRHKITISTLSTLGNLQIKFPYNHFTHIILDEAGQSVETETLIPLTFLNKKNGQVVLAGDHKQLGPVITSKFAKNLGYETSFLQRILDTWSFYARRQEYAEFGSYNPKFLTKLLKNYRSLPSILKMYNDLFYLGELIPIINDTSREAFILSSLDDILPNPGTRQSKCGLFFMSVNGTNVRSADSPSWFNREEAGNIFQFYISLIGQKIKAQDIGIITPYTQQVRTIRSLIQGAGLEVPKIGTVEEFQGQERDIILISTVRSFESELKNDQHFGLGFVNSDKRMNVAISRARALCMIFGNKKTLYNSNDGNWKCLIQYTINNGTYSGSDIVCE